MNDGDFINFSNFENTEQIQHEFNASFEQENTVAQKTIELFKKWQLNGRNIEEIFDKY